MLLLLFLNILIWLLTSLLVRYALRWNVEEENIFALLGHRKWILTSMLREQENVFCATMICIFLPHFVYVHQTGLLACSMQRTYAHALGT